MSNRPASKSRRTPAQAAAPVHRAKHEIRIIGGQWKRTKLRVDDRPGLRPTPDRVRETLFNWLGQELTGWRCVDAFAGTGVLGFEAASRGAADVLLVEQDPALVALLKAAQSRLQASAVRIVRGDAVTALRQLAPHSVDLIFLDPPFGSTLVEATLQTAAAALAAQGRIYLEAPIAWTNESLASCGLAVSRQLKAGAVHAHLLEAAATRDA